MLFIVFPSYLPSLPILHKHSITLFFICRIISLIHPSQSALFSKTPLSVFLPFSSISVSQSFVFIDSPAIPSIIFPLTIINIVIFVSFHSKQDLVTIKEKTIVNGSLLQLSFVKLQRIHPLSIFIQIVYSLDNNFFDSHISLINSNNLFLESLLLLLDLIKDPTFLFQEMHFIKEHICAFFSTLEILKQNLSASEQLLIVYDSVQLLNENLMPNLLTEHLPDYLPYLFQLKALLEILFQLLRKLLLVTLFNIVSIDCFQQAQPYFINFVYYSHCHSLHNPIFYIESCIDILHHITNIRIMLGHKLKYLSVFYIKGPISKFFNITFFNLVNGQKVLIVNFMVFKKASFADQPCKLFTLRVNAYIEYLLAFMAWYQTLGGY